MQARLHTAQSITSTAEKGTNENVEDRGHSFTKKDILQAVFCVLFVVGGLCSSQLLHLKKSKGFLDLALDRL